MHKQETVTEGTTVYKLGEDRRSLNASVCLTNEIELHTDIDRLDIQCGAEFEFYLCVKDLQQFNKKLEEIVSDLLAITDAHIAVNTTYGIKKQTHLDDVVHKNDDSLTTTPYGIEITTPILPLARLPYYVEKLLVVIRNHGFTDETTGLHIHLSHTQRENPFDFLKFMLFMNDKGLFESWQERSDYCSNVMHVLNFKDVAASKKKKDKIGERWNVLLREKDHVEIRTMGGQQYEDQVVQILQEITALYTLFSDASDVDKEREKYAVLQKRQADRVEKASPEDTQKYLLALKKLGLFT